MTKNKERLTGKIMVFLDGKALFSLNGDMDSWKQKEKLSFARESPFQIEVGDLPPGPPSPPKTIESKIVAKIEMKDKQDEDILCIFCYELIEPTRNQIVQDIVKIKQELSA